MANGNSISQKLEAINLLELESKARELLPPAVYDYYAGGANDELTLRENRAAYERITLLPRVLTDSSRRDVGTTALGEKGTCVVPALHLQGSGNQRVPSETGGSRRL